jgi:hypothetical protein
MELFIPRMNRYHPPNPYPLLEDKKKSKSFFFDPLNCFLFFRSPSHSPSPNQQPGCERWCSSVICFVLFIFFIHFFSLVLKMLNQ